MKATTNHLRDTAYIIHGKSTPALDKAMANLGKTICDIGITQRSISSANNAYRNIDTRTSVREAYTRYDYGYFRPNEAIPEKQSEIISYCMSAYQKVGLIRNVIDLMGDFAAQGVRIVHPNKQIENFYDEWFKKVRGKERSERFLNMLYRSGNVIVKRTTAKFRVKDIENLRRGLAAADMPASEIPNPNTFEPEKNEIPCGYTFLNPLSVEPVGGELSTFVGKPLYALKLPDSLRRKIASPQNETEKQLVSKLPAYIRNAVAAGQRSIVLDPDKLAVYHYKKDDWMIWANPMVYSILDDLILLEKMKLADLSALDGAISHIRIWKLGIIEKDVKVLPTPDMLSNLSDMLLNVSGNGGVLDLIWGPDIELIETSTDIYKFLGEDKYKSVMNNIYAGLGVPPTLTGSSTSSGFTNNYISLKTLIERLNYGRSILEMFWQNELQIVQKALGHKFPARVVFDRMTLSDEAAEKALLLQLVDRAYLSPETLLDRFGEIPELEQVRLKRYDQDVNAGRVPPKAGPWFAPEKEHDYKKAFIQTGVLTPSELGVQLEERKDGQKPPLEMRAKKQADSLKGRPGQGRPLGAKDSTKRKQKRVLPRGARASEQVLIDTIWARNAFEQIAAFVTPGFLESKGKNDVRSLTHSEAKALEDIKFGILMQLESGDVITGEFLAELMQSNSCSVPPEAELLVQGIAQKITERGIQLKTSDFRGIQSFVFGLIKEGNCDETGDNSECLQSTI